MAPPAASLATVPLAHRPTAEPEMVLSFRLSGETFAMPVACVHEILDPIPRTEVPNAPDCVPALVNVRGSVAPLFDVRRRLRMAQAKESATARIVVLELPINGAPTKLAMVADSVNEVIEVDLGALEAVPELGARWPDHFVKGVARHDGALVVLLDPETLFAPDADRPATPA